MPLEQIVVLAIVQGITEFLPISSSGHLILIPAFTGWPDQGLATDVMVHVGSLFAILAYFWRDVIMLAGGVGDILRRRWTDRARLALYLAAATDSRGPLRPSAEMARRSRQDPRHRGCRLERADLRRAALRGRRGRSAVEEDGGHHVCKGAMIIGVAQAIALIPGTSRSGITMTAARFLGFERAEAARFSFLLGIPAITGAGILTVIEMNAEGHSPCRLAPSPRQSSPSFPLSRPSPS